MAYWLTAERTTDATNGFFIRFATQHSDQPLMLHIPLRTIAAGTSPPELDLQTAASGCELTITPAGPDFFDLCLTVPAAGPASEGVEDDELTFVIRSIPPSPIPDCHIVLRRTACRISTALIARQRDAVPVRPQSLAALLWYGWRRYSEIVGLRRFTSGKSGSDVLVFQPRLRDPVEPSLTHGMLPGVISESWGSCLLVKTGSRESVSQEWTRYRTFLRDRLHPFMSRSEEFLTVRPVHVDGDTPTGATMIGSFLGGELLQAESFEQLVTGSSDADRCLQVLDRLFSIMGTWYSGHSVRPLSDWTKVFDWTDPAGALRLFGEFDFRKEADRKRYRAALAWDVPFIQQEHLQHHLLGKPGSAAKTGLLPELMNWPVRYSLAHGDLHTRNILADENDVWVLDFGQVGVMPTLFDFAKLEIYLRLWCLRLEPSATGLPDATRRFENLLLDHMTGSESSLEPVRRLAEAMGADSDDLLRVARCICHIRRHSVRYSQGSPDRRDYLAILYLTTLGVLQFTRSDPELRPNFRLLVSLAWVLEDVLSRMAGLEPYPRNRLPADPRRLVTPLWLAGPGAPGRVAYLMDSGRDAEALAPLAATRGVLQNDSHHLDVFDHTLLVLGYIEQLLDDPLTGFLQPGDLDGRVRENLLEQGLPQPEYSIPVPEGASPDVDVVTPYLDDIRQLLADALTEETSQILKWAALLHDVGKPSTRRVNVTGGGRVSVQFLGHEVYGEQLVGEQLRQLFPDRNGEADPHRSGIEYLILRHHDHHNLVNRYAGEPDKLAALRDALATRELPAKERKYLGGFLDPKATVDASLFPLLILHGFADVLACRGPATTTSVLAVAEIDLLLLGMFLRFPAILQREAATTRFAELTKGLRPEIGITGPAMGPVMDHLRRWYLQQADDGQPEPAVEVVRDDLLAEARRYIDQSENSPPGRS